MANIYKQKIIFDFHRESQDRKILLIIARLDHYRGTNFPNF